MKIAVISFSGNVGKSTIARHLLAPRMPGAKVVCVESINAAEGEDHVIRGRQFAELQEYLQVVDDVIVDIGASNVEELLALMRRYRGSHEDFDYFIVPTVPAGKQQQDTMATLAELSRLGVPADKVRLVFNMVEDGIDIERVFDPVLAFVRLSPVARVSLDCRLGINEIYGRVNGSDADLSALAADSADYKSLIAAATDSTERLALAQRLATRRLASGVVPELDACFVALALGADADTCDVAAVPPLAEAVSWIDPAPHAKR
jgi:hypothetical protein